MPAVTADTLTLPRLPEPEAGAPERPVESVTAAPSGYEGEGFPVRRAYAPGEPKGTDWHPHRGFETVTYIIDGTFAHQDSHGGGGLITDGATQWMTAGGGILHIETPPEELVVSGGLFNGVQLWVNLPAKDKMIAPAYQNLEPDLVTLVSTHDGGGLVRLIAGPLGPFAGPGSTHTPITVAHLTLAAGARAVLPWPKEFNSLVWAFDGQGTVGSDSAPIRGGQLAVLGVGDTLTITADDSAPLDVLLLGGRPIGEPVAQ